MTKDAPRPESPGQSPAQIPAPAPRALREARVVSWVLDDLVRVPGTRRRLGLDPLIGLIPGLGDWAGWVASAHLLLAGARMGAPAPVLIHMAGNALLDAALGAVPVLGDLFDVGWKANRRNLALLERLAREPVPAARASRALLGVILLGLLGLTSLSALGAIMFFRWVLHSMGLLA